VWFEEGIVAPLCSAVMTTSQIPRYCWEHFAVGRCVQHSGMPVSREGLLEFARQFDPPSFHVDEEAERHGASTAS
jgi:acyl dehydratase